MKIPFLPNVRKTILQHEMLSLPPRMNRVVVAVSGGPDSLALLHTLFALQKEYRLALSVAHLDHALRPESGDEARFVRQVARSLGLAYYAKRVDVAKHCRRRKLSLEEGAREVRYAFLEGMAEKAGAERIAVGHTMDDQAETILMRLIRGAGPAGLAGIPAKRGKIIRPLLGVRREAIISFLERAEIPYLRDPSNQETRFLRNRIRLSLIPLLEGQFNPRIVEALARTGQLLEKERVREKGQEPSWEEVIVRKGAGKTTKIVLDLSILLGYNKRLRRKAIREVLRRLRGDLRQVGLAHVDAVIALVKARVGGVAALPGGFRARKGYGEISFEKALPEAQPRPFLIPVAVPGVTKLPSGKLRISFPPVSKAPRVWRKTEGRVGWFAVERIHFPLKIRTRKEGDRFWPLGLPGPKRLKEILIDDKVPRGERDGLPLLTDREGILWIVGHRIAERTKVLAETKKVLKAEFISR